MGLETMMLLTYQGTFQACGIVESPAHHYQTFLLVELLSKLLNFFI